MSDCHQLMMIMGCEEWNVLSIYCFMTLKFNANDLSATIKSIAGGVNRRNINLGGVDIKAFLQLKHMKLIGSNGWGFI